jgi:hypothetical protein
MRTVRSGFPANWPDANGELPIDDGEDKIEELSWSLQQSVAQSVNAEPFEPTPLWSWVGFAATQALVSPLDMAEVRLDSAEGPWALMLCATRDGRRLMLPSDDIAHHEFSDGPAEAHVARRLLRADVPDVDKILDAMAKLRGSPERPSWANRYPRFFPPDTPLLAEARADYSALVRTVLDQTAEYTLADALHASEFRGAPTAEIRRRWMLAIEGVFAPGRHMHGTHDWPLLAFVKEDGGLVLPARCIDAALRLKAFERDITRDMLRRAERQMAEASTEALVGCGMPPSQAWRVSGWTLHEMLSRIDNGSYAFESGERLAAVLCFETADGALTLPRSDRQIAHEVFAALQPAPDAARS